MILPLRRYAEFHGRSRRREFWGFMLFLVLSAALAVWLDILLGTGGARNSTIVTEPGLLIATTMTRVGWITRLFLLAMVVPALAVRVRRLHDVDWRGWWLLIAFVPFAGVLLLLILYLTNGTRGPNRFGQDPAGSLI